MKRMSVAVVSFAAIVAVSCSRGPDPSEGARKTLKDANLAQVQVDWDRDARVAHVKGSVDTPTDRDRAGEVVSAAVGTTGTVLNELTIKGVNDRTAAEFDGQIKRTLEKMVDNDPVLRDRDIDFDVNNGVVTVKGTVRTAAEKNKITQYVHAAPGVKDMANALEIGK